MKVSPLTTRKKLQTFNKFIETTIAENSIRPDDIISMDEVPLMF